MDSVLVAAARALSRGDPLGALQRVALRDDPPALALRGIALAQLGDYARARPLLRRAERSFEPGERRERARCRVAEAEVALAARDLGWSPLGLRAAAALLDGLGDHANALHARLILARRHLLVGALAEAEKTLAAVDAGGAPPAVAAVAELVRTELALRRILPAEAEASLARARTFAGTSGIPALVSEVERLGRLSTAPAARWIRPGEARLITLAEVAEVFSSSALIVDACRRALRGPELRVSLATRPVLFHLLRALAEAWPADVPRDLLIRRTFEVHTINASHRARLRVELGRLRKLLGGVARIEATEKGFALVPLAAREVSVLAPPVEGPAGELVALLEGGEAWSTSALAAALGASQRSVQRELRGLEEAGTVRAVGRGRTAKWVARTLGGFAPTLLLPGALPLH